MSAIESEEEAAAPGSARALISGALARQLGEAVDEAHAGVFEIDAYRLNSSRSLREDVGEHIEAHFNAALEAFADGRIVTREDVVPIRPRATRRLDSGISVADFIHAFEASEDSYLRRMLQFAEDRELSRELPDLILSMRQYFYLATVEAAEVYLEAERQRAASSEGIRRDLLEELLAGRPPAPGTLLDAARSAGLDSRSPCVVVAAVVTAPVDQSALRAAAATLARAAGGPVQPLTVVRRDDVVIVLPAPNDGEVSLATRLEHAQQQVADQGVPLAVGVSTVRGGLETVAEAYSEASAACERLLPSPGVVALPTMNTLDYLMSRGDGTARNLIRPPVARFVLQDLEAGGELIDTVSAYFDADLNAKLAAERLHVHVNTVYYRLSKIGESSRCDLRRVGHVVEILIAARLLGRA